MFLKPDYYSPTQGPELPTWTPDRATVKQFLRIESTDEDSMIDYLLAAAVEKVSAFLRWPEGLGAGTFKVTFPTSVIPGDGYVIDIGPLTSIATLGSGAGNLTKGEDWIDFGIGMARLLPDSSDVQNWAALNSDTLAVSARRDWTPRTYTKAINHAILAVIAEDYRQREFTTASQRYLSGSVKNTILSYQRK